MDCKVLVEDYRGGILENIQMGVICGINATGDVIYSVGDEKLMTFLRSAAKPFQAIPVVQNGVVESFGLTSKEAAVFAASQRGEVYHIEALESILHKTDISEDQFFCSPSYPLNEELKAEYHRKKGEKRKLYHNCSGKHSGFLALSKVLGASASSSATKPDRNG